MSPLRILTVANVPPDPNSGAAGTVVQTNMALRELGHVVDEIWQHDLGPRRIRHGNLHSLLEQPWRYRDAVMKAMSKQDYDVIQMSQPQAWLAAQTLRRGKFRGLIINRSHGLELRGDDVLPQWHGRLGVPESRFPRSLATPVLRWLLQRQWRPIVKNCDGIILPCEMDCEFLNGCFPEFADRMFRVHHGISDEFVSSSPPSMADERLQRLLHVGQHAFFKGNYILYDVLNRSLSERSDLTCTWVTSKSAHAEIRSRLTDEVRSRVTLLDWRPQSELIELYDNHGVFLFPSLFEGAGKAALEALSRRMVVIASDTGGMRDYIRESDGGYLCGVGQVEEFCEAIRRIVAQPDEAARKAENGWQLARTKTWLACASGLLKLYWTLFEATGKCCDAANSTTKAESTANEDELSRVRNAR